MNWQTGVGKIGHKAVYDFIESRFGPDHSEHPREFVADILKDCNYLYKHLERKVSSSYPCSRIAELDNY